jgi:hypothetical protein
MAQHLDRVEIARYLLARGRRAAPLTAWGIVADP